MRQDIKSWNRLPAVGHQHVLDIPARTAHLPLPPDAETCIPFGNGRSYGDVCLNPDAAVIRTRALDHMITFDREHGRITCEGGVILADILELVTPQGWFPPVTPGTRFVTVGGCVANDVHGKNHHDTGSFGNHVRSFELLRSDGQRLTCSAEQNADWFAATIGGLGLTGLVTQVTFDLLPVANPFMVTQAYRFSTLDEFWQLNARAEREWPYTVAWIDCTRQSGRGILFAGQHAPPQAELPVWKSRHRTVPVDLPFSCINSLSLKVFNEVYYRQKLPRDRYVAHYAPYFYPLDAIENWNRIYGTKGFYQYQCVLPPQVSADGVAELMRQIARSGMGSFLAVLKTFGTRPAMGTLSFPRPGATLALDFPNMGEETLQLLNRLDSIVASAGGALYPAKDARMSGAMFRRGFPQWEKMLPFIDPRFSSGFWRRVNEPEG